MRTTRWLSLALLVAILVGTSWWTARAQDVPEAPSQTWRHILHARLPELGHRNWIVVADSAYPSQVSDGVITLCTDEDQLDVVQEVMNQLSEQKHVRPNIMTDTELAYVDERDASGISAYRTRLAKMLDGKAVKSVPHADLIDQLDKSGKMFKVIVIKTKMTLPYTSVFLQLDCAYWNADAEARLRAAMKADGK